MTADDFGNLISLLGLKVMAKDTSFSRDFYIYAKYSINEYV